MNDYKAKFRMGQIVHHKLFGYTGVVFDIDPFFQSSDEWYEQVAQSCPPKNKPRTKIVKTFFIYFLIFHFFLVF